MKVQLSCRIETLAKALIALERRTNGGSDGEAVERLIYRGSTSAEAHELILKEATKDPKLAALIPAFRKTK